MKSEGDTTDNPSSPRSHRSTSPNDTSKMEAEDELDEEDSESIAEWAVVLVARHWSNPVVDRPQVAVF